METSQTRSRNTHIASSICDRRAQMTNLNIDSRRLRTVASVFPFPTIPSNRVLPNGRTGSTNKKVIILTFHGIGEPVRDIKSTETPYWISEDRFKEVIDLASFYHQRPYDISLTFDDGNISDTNLAAPLLAKLNKTATYFVLPGRIGQKGFLGREEIRGLHDYRMNVESHGMHHPVWTQCTNSQLALEMDESISLLDSITGRKTSKIAVPYGSYNRRVLQALAQRDFEHVFTSDGGLSNSCNWIQPRTTIRSDTSLDHIEAFLSGRISIIYRIKTTAKVFRRSWFNVS
jgi:hypothetical protein